MLGVAYANKNLRELCEQQEKAKKELSADDADQLRKRIADLYAADYVTDVEGRPWKSGPHQDRYTVEVGDHLLVLAPNQKDVPRTKEGEIEWSKVSRVKVIAIEKADDD